MTEIKKKTIYRVTNSYNESSFTLTVSEDGIEVKTDEGLGVEEFIEGMKLVILELEEAYPV
jgi:hypothetical protein